MNAITIQVEAVDNGYIVRKLGGRTSCKVFETLDDVFTDLLGEFESRYQSRSDNSFGKVVVYREPPQVTSVPQECDGADCEKENNEALRQRIGALEAACRKVITSTSFSSPPTMADVARHAASIANLGRVFEERATR